MYAVWPYTYFSTHCESMFQKLEFNQFKIIDNKIKKQENKYFTLKWLKTWGILALKNTQKKKLPKTIKVKLIIIHHRLSNNNENNNNNVASSFCIVPIINWYTIFFSRSLPMFVYMYNYLQQQLLELERRKKMEYDHYIIRLLKAP